MRVHSLLGRQETSRMKAACAARVRPALRPTACVLMRIRAVFVRSLWSRSFSTRTANARLSAHHGFFNDASGRSAGHFLQMPSFNQP